MSVYTPVSASELAHFLTRYSVGELLEHQGILAGVENTNYFVTTTQGQFVLTLFEQHADTSMAYFLQLMHFWAEKGIPTPRPIRDQNGQFLQTLNHKPATLVMRLTGHELQQPNAAQCFAVGACLARMHVTGTAFPLYRAPDRGHDWRVATAQRLLPEFSYADAQLLQAELAVQNTLEWQTLPQGVIHADLFRDNALFDGDTLTGVIDLYYACNDVWVYDLAIVLNDWCFDGPTLNHTLIQACLQGYQSVRVLTPTERRAGLLMQRAAALRFWLSRALAKLNAPANDLVLVKDPNEFKAKLLNLIEDAPRLEANWQIL